MKLAVGRGRVGHRRWTAALVAGALVAAWGAVPARGQDSGPRWEVVVGRETPDHAIQGQAFFPMVVTVQAGDMVRWSLGGQYSHTVTFLSRQPGPINPVVTPDGRTIVNPLLEYAQGGTTYDGTRYTNSGILSPRASTYDLTFSTPGVYSYVCMLHRGMDGTVVVLPTSSPVPKTAAEYKTLGEREWAVVRERGEGLALSAPMVTEPVPGGAMNYYISSGFGGNEASILRFLPPELVVRVGDTVTWVQSDPQEMHTVTFSDTDPPSSLTTVETGQFGPPSTVLDPQATQPQGGPVHRGVGYYNSGIMQPFARYTLTFLQPGTYSYICIPHASLGQIGTIVVQP